LRAPTSWSFSRRTGRHSSCTGQRWWKGDGSWDSRCVFCDGPPLGRAQPVVRLMSPFANATIDTASSVGELARAETLTFASVYATYFAFAWRNVRRMGVPDAALDDVVQEVFVAVHKRLSSFEQRSSLRSWMVGIIVRCVHRHRRTTRRKSPHTLDREPPTDPETLRDESICPQEAAARAEAGRIVHDLLDQLDEDKRTVLVLVEFEHLSAGEIAEALGIGINTVYSRLRLAREEFAEAAARYRARDGWRAR
jgi:RNA polymerase sigma-70 factor (ECF subfamily)